MRFDKKNVKAFKQVKAFWQVKALGREWSKELKSESGG